MLFKLGLKNFRAFENEEINLSKLNIFVGPNNSGKSSILSSIALLAQSMRSNDQGVNISLNGGFVELGTYEDMVHNNNVEKDICISVGIRTKEKSILEYVFSYQEKEILIKRFTIYNFKKDGTKKKELEAHWDLIKKKYLLKKWPSKMKGAELNFHNILPVLIKEKGKGGIIFSNSDIYDIFVNRLEYIGPFREYPLRNYSISGKKPLYVGRTGNGAIDLLFIDNYQVKNKSNKLSYKLSQWYKDAGIAEHIKIKPLGNRNFEIKLKNLQTNEEENLMDVGFGCSQILPILVGGYNLRKNSYLIIEQPEIHLHPRAQSELGSFFVDLTKKGVQSFIETHSEHLILRVQKHISAGDIKPSDIRVFYVYADNEKKIKELKFGKDGFFTEPWPEGFFPERTLELKEIFKNNDKKGRK